MIPRITMREALADPQLLGNALAGDSWRAWHVLLIAAMGEALDDDERALFRRLTGREREPGTRVEEFVGVIGRRGGKSRAIAVLAAYIGALCEHPALVAGERGIALIIADDQRQADIVLDYIEAAFRGSPVLSQLVEVRTTRALRLTNHIDVEVRASDFRRLRGPTYIIVIGDEVAFWRTENSSNPDTEILNAVRPGLATTDGQLFLISSPYARRGELWRTFDQHFGDKGDPRILVAQGPTRTFNPTLPQAVVDRAHERDPAAAAAEYGAEFRRDIEAFISIEQLRACISSGVFQRQRQHGYGYLAFADPAGGSGSDSMTLAIGHLDSARETAVLDLLREVQPPFSPEMVAGEFAQALRSYGLSNCTGDRYGGLWVGEQFSKFGIRYEPVAEPKNLLYGSLLATVNSRRCDLLDNRRLVDQLLGLERRTSRIGHADIIDHAPNGHDDIANAAAGCIATLIGKGSYNLAALADGLEDDPYGVEGWRSMRRNAYLLSGGALRLW